MKVIDKTNRKIDLFENLCVGDIFKKDYIFIKISANEVFNLDRNYKIGFQQDKEVQVLDAKLILRG